MKQVLQSYKTGELWLAEVPAPACRPGGIVIRNTASFVSAGTERMLVDFARKNLVGKALAMPDQVRKVIRKVKAEGLFSTLEKVRAKLDQPIPLGYSCCGLIEEIGHGIDGFVAGDRVACGGAGYANHAEYNHVPKNLVVRVPEGVSDEDASCTTAGSIALQGARQCDVRVGEVVCVLGLGLLGLLAVQILKASGTRVIGFDPDSSRCGLAESLGVDHAVAHSQELTAVSHELTSGHGVDAVLITAATKSSEPVALAGDLCRTRGKVVVTGMVGMDIPRDQYYKKELDFKLSLSYGPGRYDPAYEEGGHDYPYGYVRWTEQRNMRAFLDLVADGKVTPEKLVTHRFDFDNALDAYELMLGKKEPYLGIVLHYQRSEDRGQRTEDRKAAPRKDAETQSDINLEEDKKVRGLEGEKERTVQLKEAETLTSDIGLLTSVCIGFIGAGNFAKGVLLPQLRKLDSVRLKGICTATGMNAAEIGKKEGFESATTDRRRILEDPDINTIFIATRHDTHARFVCEALKAGKHVFVEKPLCLTIQELEEIRGQRTEVRGETSGTGKSDFRSPTSDYRQLMVGFNRRFSPLVQKMKEVVQERPMAITYRINAGVIPRDSWIQDLEIGGGRIVGEVCHFIDTIAYLTGSLPKSVYAASVRKADQSIPDEDNIATVIHFKNGSTASINYMAYGNEQVPKEYIEVFCGDVLMQMSDFRTLSIYRGNRKERVKNRWQDKGFENELRAFINAIKSGEPPIPFDSLYQTTRATFAVRDSLRTGFPVEL